MSDLWPRKANKHREQEGTACDGCVICRATEAGAREIANQAGLSYDALSAHHQSHYGYVAQQVMTAMSAVIAEDPDVAVQETP